MSSDDTKSTPYQHKDKKEMQVFLQIKVRAAANKAKKDSPSIMRAYANAALAEYPGADNVAKTANKKTANEDLFTALVGLIGNEDLLLVLATQYDNKGYEAMQYIKSCFAQGDDDNLMTDANESYLEAQTTKLTTDVTVQDFVALINQMQMARIELHGTKREIDDIHHAHNLPDMLRRISNDYRTEVRHAMSKLGAADLDNPLAVQPILEGVIKTMNKAKSESDSSTATLLKTLASRADSDPEVMATIRKLTGSRPPPATDKLQCPECGKFHVIKDRTNQPCRALLLSKGELSDNELKRLPPQVQASVKACAKEIKEQGRFADRKPKVALLRPPSPPQSKPKVQFTGVEYPTTQSIIYMDSQGGVNFNYHFIADKHLFQSLDESAPVVEATGVVPNAGSVKSRGLGTCPVKIIHPDGGYVSIVLQNCLYVPDMGMNVFNCWHSSDTAGHSFLFNSKDPKVLWSDGGVLPMLSDFTIRVIPDRPAVFAVSASVITRGRHGATHVDAKPLSPIAQAEFDLTLQRLNDPAPARAKNLHKVMDNVPEVLQKANYNNTATDARMLANAPLMPAPQSTRDKSDRVGGKSLMDGWDSGVISLLGNRYMLGISDEASHKMWLGFAKKKSEFPDLADRYFLFLQQSAPAGYDAGGVLWCDNEKIMIGARMQSVARTHNRTISTSNEYEATGNAGAESIFRMVPNEMRKIYVRTGVPSGFFEFVALESGRILDITREVEDGKSPNEMFTGERYDYDRERGSFGCKVTVRIPPPKRDDKHTPRNLLGVNLGKARNQPGWHVWTPELGLMTTSNLSFYEHVFPFKTGELTAPRNIRLHGSVRGGGGGGVSAILDGPPPDE